MASSEQIAGPQALAEFSCGKNEDTVLGAATFPFKADDHELPDPRMILRQSAQALEMICRNFDRSLCLDRDLHVVDNEVHLDAAGQAPVAESGKGLGIGVVGAQFVEDPVLEGLAI